MFPLPLLLSFFLFPLLTFSLPLKRAGVPYNNPKDGGGAMLDMVARANGLGEPLNVIISGQSDPRVLTDEGFLNWAQSVHMAPECLGIHAGTPQRANLGDGQGLVDQFIELREDYGIPFLGIGSCLESMLGGNHLRMWRQKDTGAIFMAVSQEDPVTLDHQISPNGYDIGRDKLVMLATLKPTSHNGVTYQTTKEDVDGLLPVGKEGVNHGIALDGKVALLTIKIV